MWNTSIISPILSANETTPLASKVITYLIGLFAPLSHILHENISRLILGLRPDNERRPRIRSAFDSSWQQYICRWNMHVLHMIYIYIYLYIYLYIYIYTNSGTFWSISQNSHGYVVAPWWHINSQFKGTFAEPNNLHGMILQVITPLTLPNFRHPVQI